MPSVVCVGGMRMSVSTASGWCRDTAASSSVPLPTDATTSRSSASASSAAVPSRTRKLSSANTTRSGMRGA
jgi:hypothetical protein